MNFLGLDYGESKIGLAFAPEGILAVGLKIVPNGKDFFLDLRKIIEEYRIESIIVGLPISMDGSYSIRTEKTQEFIQKLKKEFSDKKIFSYDERLSSSEAHRNIGTRKADDAEAARIILQGFLDSKSF